LMFFEKTVYVKSGNLTLYSVGFFIYH